MSREYQDWRRVLHANLQKKNQTPRHASVPVQTKVQVRPHASCSSNWMSFLLLAIFMMDFFPRVMAEEFVNQNRERVLRANPENISYRATTAEKEKLILAIMQNDQAEMKRLVECGVEITEDELLEKILFNEQPENRHSRKSGK